MSDSFYPRPLHPPAPGQTREQMIAEFKAKQGASRREIQRKLRLIRKAKRRGEPPDLGPLW